MRAAIAGFLTPSVCLLLSACAGSGQDSVSIAPVETAPATASPSLPATAPSEVELTSLLLAELERFGIDPDCPQPRLPVGAAAKAGSRDFHDYGMGSGNELAFKVDTLEFTGWTDDPDGPDGALAPSTGVLRWVEALTGDYDQNGEVGLSDITPIAQYWGEAVEYVDITDGEGTRRAPAGDPLGEGARNWRLARVDGNGDGEIGVQDLTPLAQSFGFKLDSYNLCWLVPEGDGMKMRMEYGIPRPSVEPDKPVVYTWELDFGAEPEALYLTDEDLALVDGSFSMPLDAPPPGRYFVRALAAGVREPTEVADSNLARVQYDPPAVASAYSSFGLRAGVVHNTCEARYFDTYNSIEFQPSGTGMFEFRFPSYFYGSTDGMIARYDPLPEMRWAFQFSGETTYEVEINSVSRCPDAGIVGTCTDTGAEYGYEFYSNHNPVYLFKISPAGAVEWQVKCGIRDPIRDKGLTMNMLSRSCTHNGADGITLARSFYTYAPYYYTSLVLWQQYDYSGANLATRAWEFSSSAGTVQFQPRGVSVDGQGNTRIGGDMQVELNEVEYQACCAIALSPDGSVLSACAAVFPDTYHVVDIEYNADGETFLLLKPQAEGDTALVLIKFDAAGGFAWARSFEGIEVSPEYFIQLGITPTGLPIVCGTGYVPGYAAESAPCLRPVALVFSASGEITAEYFQQYTDALYDDWEASAEFCGVSADPATGELQVLSYRSNRPFLCWSLLDPPAAADAPPLEVLDFTWEEYPLAAADEPGALTAHDITEWYFAEAPLYHGEQCWSIPLPLGEAP